MIPENTYCNDTQSNDQYQLPFKVCVTPMPVLCCSLVTGTFGRMCPDETRVRRRIMFHFPTKLPLQTFMHQKPEAIDTKTTV